MQGPKVCQKLHVLLGQQVWEHLDIQSLICAWHVALMMVASSMHLRAFQIKAECRQKCRISETLQACRCEEM